MERGIVSGLFVYPVKGCRGIALEEAKVEPTGFAHDRHWLIVRPDGRFLSQRELPALARIVPELTGSQLVLQVDGQRHLVDMAEAGPSIEVMVWRDRMPAFTQRPEIDRALSDFLGRAVRLVRFDPSVRRLSNPDVSPPGTRAAFADEFPILVTSTASLDRLNDALLEEGNEKLPMERFRPNIVIDGLSAWAEDRLPEIAIGSLRLRLLSPCERCIVTTTDQVTGERDGQEPIRTLRKLHAGPAGSPLFGWNAMALDVEDRADLLKIGDEAALSEATHG